MGRTAKIMTETNRGIEELKIAGLFDKDSDYGGMVGKAVQELLKVFEKQGHSGFSANYVASIFNKLVKGETLTPLKGEKDEWNDVSESSGKPLWQNKRCSRIFSEDEGKTGYDTEGKIFIEKGGGSYTSKESHVSVTFPYLPTTEIVNL